MSGIGSMGAAGVGYIGDAGSNAQRSFNLQTPAGWALLWWALAIVILILMFYSL